MKNSNDSERVDAGQALATYLGNPAILICLMGLATVVLYSGALTFGFVWDDVPQIVNSPILRSLKNIPRAFESDLWYHVARHQVYYRPLFVVWSMLNYAVFGLQPWGWHFGAILMHVMATLGVFWFCLRLGLEYWTAALATIIFAFHPVHIEPVVWVSAASDSMVTLFFALAFGAFIRGRDPQGKNFIAWRLASLVLLACALLTKEMAVTFFALVSVYAWLHPGEGRVYRLGKFVGVTLEALPYVAVTAAYALVRSHALARATGQFDQHHGLMDVLRTLPLVLALYTKQLLVPLGLTGLYYTPYATALDVGHVWLPALFLVGLGVVIWYWNRKDNNKVVVFAILWLLISLAPALYLRNFGNGDFVRDRYIYLPSIGFAILAAKALRKLPPLGQWSGATVQGCAVLVLCLAYATASVAQQVYWASELLVWTRGQSLYPGNPYALVGLANEYGERGAFDKSIEFAEQAVREHPDYAYGPLALSEAYIRAGRFEDGRKWLDKFLTVSPEYAKTETGIATLAGMYGRMGDFDRALNLCTEILQMEPNLYSAVYNCGNIHLMAGQYAEATRQLAHAVEMAPDQAGPRHFLGRALLQEGRNREALGYLEAAATMDPSVWDYHYWLGKALEENGNPMGARVEYQRTLQLNHESSDAKLRLAALESK